MNTDAAQRDESLYPDYAELLAQDLPRPFSSLGAIVVPSARGAEHLRYISKLAEGAQIPLVVIGSKHTTAEAIAAEFEFNDALEWYGIDLPEGYEHPAFDFHAQETIPEHLRSPSDLPDKRNIGLLLTEKCGFFDDDMQLFKYATGDYPNAQAPIPRGVNARLRPYVFSGDFDTLSIAAEQLANFAIVGFETRGAADKSVLHHIDSAVTFYNRQHSNHISSRNACFVSGNSLLVDTVKASGFFPRSIYNEDWLFTHDELLARNVAMPRVGSIQNEYDPFKTDRATCEEFGDVIAEDLFRHILEGGAHEPTQIEFWQTALKRRRMTIENVAEKLKKVPNTENRSYMVSLHGSVPPFCEVRPDVTELLEHITAINNTIEPEQCQEYYHAWRRDLEGWRQRKEQFDPRRYLTIGKRIINLDLKDYTISSIPKSRLA